MIQNRQTLCFASYIGELRVTFVILACKWEHKNYQLGNVNEIGPLQLQMGLYQQKDTMCHRNVLKIKIIKVKIYWCKQIKKITGLLKIRNSSLITILLLLSNKKKAIILRIKYNPTQFSKTSVYLKVERHYKTSNRSDP